MWFGWNVKCGVLVLAAFGLVLSGNVYASDVVERVRALIAHDVTIDSIEESEGYVDLSGTVADNTQVASLMRAVNDAGVGDPLLQSIVRDGNVSRFQLRIRLRR